MKKLLAIVMCVTLCSSCKDDDTAGEPFTISGRILENCKTSNPAVNQEFALAIPVASSNRGQAVDVVYERFKTNQNGEFSITSNRKVYNNSLLSITGSNVSSGPGFPILSNIPNSTVNVGSFFANPIGDDIRVKVGFNFDLSNSTLVEGDSVKLEWMGGKRRSPSELAAGNYFYRNWPLQLSYSAKFNKSIFLLTPPVIIRYKSLPLTDVNFIPIFEVPFNCDTAINLTIKMP